MRVGAGDGRPEGTALGALEGEGRGFADGA